MKTYSSSAADDHGNCMQAVFHERSLPCLIRCVSLLLLAAPGFGVAPLAFGAETVGIEEIVVTARKREERLLDTPIAVTAVTGADMDRLNIKSLSGVAESVPNMTFDLGTGSTGGSNNAQIYIRGVGQQDFLFSSDPGVGLYIDGVFFARTTGVMMDLLDLQQVEVLRGPQGTLFGKNTIGGAIIITSRQPGDEFEGLVQGVVGSRDRTDLQGVVNVPMIPDQLSMRLSASVRKQDGFVDRINAGDETGDTDSQFARALMRWTPTQDWTVDLALDVTRKRESSAPEELINVGSPASNPLLGLWNALVAPSYGPGVQYDNRYLSDESESQATGPNRSDFDMLGVSISAVKEFNDSLSFKSITAYRDQHSKFGSDTDHSPLEYTESTTDNEHDQFSQEFQLTGTSFGERMDWVLGAFYMHEEGSDLSNYILGGGLYDALEALPGAFIPLAPGVQCPAPFPAPCVGGAGNPYNVGLDLDINLDDQIDIDSYALFGESNFALTDKLNLTTGVRYSYDKKKFVTSLLRNTAGVYTVQGDVSDDWDNVSPRVGLKYQFSDAAMVYASVTGGFKSGGFNGRSTSLEQIDSFNPETVLAYEIGAKLTTADRRFGVNMAAFHSDYDDMQLLSVRNVQGVIVIVTENAGKVVIDGVELELVAAPVEGLNFRAGIGYLDAEYDELDPGASVTTDLDLVKTPKWTTSASVDYTFAMGDAGKLTLAANAAYRSQYVNELTNEPELVQDGFTLYGASIRYMEPGERWSITGFGINLGDERYMTNGLTSYGSFGNSVANFAPPREWGVKFTLQF